jgi:hypothetical protein
MLALRTQLSLALFLTVLVGMSEMSFAFQSQDEQEAANVSSTGVTFLTPEQMPAGPVVINFHNGELTIQAHNCKLGEVLHAVSRETGALIDVPGQAEERVFGEFGPGPVANVLASLLNGSHFNYVMVGRADNPHALTRVTLTPKPAELPPGKNSLRPQSKWPDVAIAQVNSNPPRPEQSEPAPGQVEATLSAPAVSAPEKEANLLNDLATELGPEAAKMDPADRRVLQEIITQMNRQNAVDSSSAAQTSASEVNGATSSPPPVRRRRRRR